MIADFQKTCKGYPPLFPDLTQNQESFNMKSRILKFPIFFSPLCDGIAGTWICHAAKVGKILTFERKRAILGAFIGGGCHS